MFQWTIWPAWIVGVKYLNKKSACLWRQQSTTIAFVGSLLYALYLAHCTCWLFSTSPCLICFWEKLCILQKFYQGAEISHWVNQWLSQKSYLFEEHYRQKREVQGQYLSDNLGGKQKKSICVVDPLRVPLNLPLLEMVSSSKSFTWKRLDNCCVISKKLRRKKVIYKYQVKCRDWGLSWRHKYSSIALVIKFASLMPSLAPFFNILSPKCFTPLDGSRNPLNWSNIYFCVVLKVINFFRCRIVSN